MAVITFSRPVSFPTAPLRDLLQKHLPRFKWQCGEQDMGGAKEMGRFLDHMLIVGRSSDTAIFTELRAIEIQAPGPGAAACPGICRSASRPPISPPSRTASP